MDSNYSIEVDQIDVAKWHELLGEFEDATVYQTQSFGAVCWEARQLSHLVVKQEATVVAATQVRIVAMPVIGKGIAYVRWGPLFRKRGTAPNPEIFRQAIGALKKEYVEKRGLLLRVIPNVYNNDSWEAEIRKILSDEGLIQDADDPVYQTIRVDVSMPLEDLRKGLHQRWRNKLKKAEGDGYTIIETDTDEAYARFSKAYDEMMARKQFATTVDIKEFAEVHRLLPSPLKLHLLLCEKDGVLLNALVVARGGDTGIYLLAATSDAGLESNGAFLLQWRALQFLKNNRCRWYDMGGINPEKNPGVYQFKSGVGGQDVRQLGRWEHRGSVLSSLAVGMGEKLKETKKRFFR